MYALARPLLFTLPPDVAHAMGMAALAPLEHVAPLRAIARALFAPRRPSGSPAGSTRTRSARGRWRRWASGTSRSGR
jgi:hypothetical protein